MHCFALRQQLRGARGTSGASPHTTAAVSVVGRTVRPHGVSNGTVQKSMSTQEPHCEMRRKNIDLWAVGHRGGRANEMQQESVRTWPGEGDSACDAHR